MARTKQTAQKSANSRAPRKQLMTLAAKKTRPLAPMVALSQNIKLGSKVVSKVKRAEKCVPNRSLWWSSHLERPELNSGDRSDFSSKVGSSNVGCYLAGRLAKILSTWYWILQMPRKIWTDEQYLFDNMPATEVQELIYQSTTSSR